MKEIEELCKILGRKVLQDEKVVQLILDKVACARKWDADCPELDTVKPLDFWLLRAEEELARARREEELAKAKARAAGYLCYDKQPALEQVLIATAHLFNCLKHHGRAL